MPPQTCSHEADYTPAQALGMLHQATAHATVHGNLSLSMAEDEETTAQKTPELQQKRVTAIVPMVLSDVSI
jgi:hypothetical protein